MTPKQEQKYRDATHKDTMAGITSPRFKCSSCKNHCSTIGRKKYGKDFICRMCNQGKTDAA